MLKKSSASLSKKRSTIRRAKRTASFGVAVLCLLTTLSVGTVLGPWKNSFRAAKLTAWIAEPVPPPTIPPPNNPSKEYIYVGGKLVATEEPTSGSSLAAPLSLVATTTSTSSIAISWQPTSGAHHYEIEKTDRLNKPFLPVSTNVATTSFTDSNVFSVNAYLYRVRAVDSSGNVSPYSNIDVATAITFTDNPLTANATVIKGQHVTELRQAVSAMLDTALLPIPTWTDNLASLSGVTIKAQHVEELRTNLDAALSTLGVPVGSYSDSQLSGVQIKKIHIDELRERVK